MNVNLIHVEPCMVAVLEHHGHPELVMETVQRFIAWRKESGLSPVVTSQTYGIAYTRPDILPETDFRFDVCGSVQAAVPDNPHGVINKTIPAGRRAVVRHTGPRELLVETVVALLTRWLPESGQKRADFPLYFHYLTLGSDSADDEVTDIYLPLAE